MRASNDQTSLRCLDTPAGHHRSPPRPRRGFSLVETMVAVGIAGLLSALTAGGLDALRQRAVARNFVSEFALELANARLVAAQHGQAVIVVLHAEPGDPDSGVFVYLDGSPRIDIHDLEQFPIPLADHPGARLLSTTPLGSARLAQVDWAHLEFPATSPFASLLAQASANPPPEGGACSFCRSYGRATRGAVRVQPDGRYAFSRSGAALEPDAQGGGVLVAHSPDGTQDQAVAFLAPSGLFRLFSR